MTVESLDPPAAPVSLHGFLDELLAEQSRLDTPVARFSRAHDSGTPAQHSLLHAPLAPQLIPLTAPGPGERYAFEVDLDACSGCKSCVAACHALNGLDEMETWRDVGLLIGGDSAHPFQQTITSACHHCTDPACLHGCPVLAYEQDPVTGIVRHLDDQCIGCQYCVLKCPYDAPKYNARLGIVRKCDLCHGRLAAGEAPACARSCPTQAIKIIKVSVVPDTSTFLASAPPPDYTRPTTRYRTNRQLPSNLRPADASNHPPQPTHAPLVVMLTLMPAAVGMSAWAAGYHLGAGGMNHAYYASNAGTAAVIAGAVGLAASVLHLGQPWRAWRIFLGWRRSWLSREALLFGAWFAAAAGARVFPAWNAWAALLGGAGLVCSAMIYVDTRRALWRPGSTFLRFFGSAVVLAAALPAPRVALAVLGVKLLGEIVSVLEVPAAFARVRGPLRKAAALRLGLGVAALGLLAWGPAPLALAVVLAGEFADRYLFFRAVDAPKMPGMAA